MRSLRNEVDMALAAELYNIVAKRRALDKREKELKAHFKGIGSETIKVGPYLIMTKEASTTSLDRARLAADMGEDFLAKYVRETRYSKLEILKDGGN